MISLRPARPGDIEHITACQLAMALETESLRLEPAVVAAGVAAVFDRPERGRYWIAEVEGELAGCLMTMDEWSDWRNGTVVWIHSAYVAPRFRRRGVFRAMYALLRERVAGDPALKGLRLFVDRGNEAAQRTYRALGMSDDHYTMFEWLKT